MVADKLNMEEVLTTVLLSHEYCELIVFYVLGSINYLFLNNKFLILLLFPRLLLFAGVLKLLLLNYPHFLVLEEGGHRHLSMVPKELYDLAVIEKMADPLVAEETEDGDRVSVSNN